MSRSAPGRLNEKPTRVPHAVLLLVFKDDHGNVLGIRYDELAPMLLNEMQRQQSEIAAQDARIRAQEQRLAKLAQMNESMRAALDKLLESDQRVAMR